VAVQSQEGKKDHTHFLLLLVTIVQL
jgi:hypothetical protein